MNLVIDSAVYLDWMRQKVDPREQLGDVVQDGRLYNCGMIRAEVLRGIKNPKIVSGMQSFFDVLPEISSDARLWRDVSDLAWRLQREGKSPSLSDLVIALSAQGVRGTLVSPDAHFEDVPGLLLQKNWPS